MTAMQERDPETSTDRDGGPGVGAEEPRVGAGVDVRAGGEAGAAAGLVGTGPVGDPPGRARAVAGGGSARPPAEAVRGAGERPSLLVRADDAPVRGTSDVGDPPGHGAGPGGIPGRGGPPGRGGEPAPANRRFGEARAAGGRPAFGRRAGREPDATETRPVPPLAPPSSPRSGDPRAGFAAPFGLPTAEGGSSRRLGPVPTLRFEPGGPVAYDPDLGDDDRVSDGGAGSDTAFDPAAVAAAGVAALRARHPDARNPALGSATPWPGSLGDDPAAGPGTGSPPPAHADRAADLAARVEALEDEAWTLREIAERYRSMLEVSGDAILRSDADHVVLFANEGFWATFGLAPEAVIGRRLDAVLVGLTLPGSEAAPAASPAPDLPMATTSGPRWFSVRDIPLPSRPGDPSALQTMLRDVTERRAIETELARARDMAEAANAAKSNFLALASHEIRTPLNGILGMADLLLETPLTSEQQTYARAVRTSGDALLSLVDDVLDLGKIEAGRLALSPEPADLEAAVESVVELLAPRAQAKGIELAAALAAGLPERLVFDAPRLRQVLINLAGNAVKFTDQGGVAVTVTGEPAGGGAWRVSVAVADTGIGIAPADRERIFREYEQADSGPARRFGGTGLGLAISRAIVERMGGAIKVESRLGTGSVFTVTVELPIAGPAVPPEVRPRPLAGRRILLVSPGRIEPEILADRLVQEGAVVARADGVTPALALMRGGPPFAALAVDHRAGFDAGLVLAELSASVAAVPPACVLLAPSDRAALERLRGAGFAGYLVRPVRARSLAKVIGALVEGRPVVSDAMDPRLPAPLPTRSGRSLAVLVADDNPINALLARALLERLGHRADLVGDGAAAVAAVETARLGGRPYDVVLMDLHMPVLDGYAAIRRIRAAEAAAGLARRPIMALTADTTPDTERDARAVGADLRLVKPIDADRLAAVLDEIAAAVLPRAG